MCFGSTFVTWQAKHAFTVFSTISFIRGNHSFDRINDFVLSIPWWPSCAISTALFRSAVGRTIRVPRSSTPSCDVSSSFTLAISFSSCCICESGTFLISNHLPFCTSCNALVIAMSSIDAVLTSCHVIAFGVEVSAMNETYSSATVCLSVVLFSTGCLAM